MTTNLEKLAETILAPVGDASGKLALHVLDTLGAWHAGTRVEEMGLLKAMTAASPGFAAITPDTPLDRLAQRVATVRATEIDDIHMESCTTVGSVIVPVALTLAGVLGTASAKTFAQSVAAGYEVMVRLGLAVSGATILYRGIWPTYFSGPIGAAATAAPLLGLNPAQTANALAIALASTCGALGGPSEASPRFLVLGQAARAGVFAALAAAKGYQADRTLLDGEWLQKTHGIALDTTPLLAVKAGDGAIDAISYKPFCAAKQNTAAIDGFRQILAKVKAEDIASVKVKVPPSYAGMIGHKHAAKGRIERVSSTAYQFALCAYHPDMVEDVVRPNLSQEAPIAAFMAKVEVAADPDLAAYFPKTYPARVEATLHNGEKITQLVTDATGDPARPLDAKDVIAKFHRLATPVAGKDIAARMEKAALGATTNDASLKDLIAAIATVPSLDVRS